MPVRIGLAGLGIHGQRYARHLLQGDVPGATLAAVSRRDVNAGRTFATEHGIAFVEDPAELATHNGIDAVVLCLPPVLHGDVAAACAAAGRPTLVEKPLATTAAAAYRIAAAVQRSGALLMPAHTLRFDPLVGRMFDERDGLGDLCGISINQRFEPSGRAWIDTPGCGGMLLNTGVHEFDLVRYLTGREAIAVSAITAARQTRETEDQFVAALELEGGPLATVDASRASASRSGRIELIGTKGQLWGDHVHRTLCRVVGRERDELGPVAPANTLPLTLTAFVKSLRDGQPPAIDIHDGVAAVEMVEAALLSATEKRRVTIAELRSTTGGSYHGPRAEP